jgi:hypothetical protein
VGLSSRAIFRFAQTIFIHDPVLLEAHLYSFLRGIQIICTGQKHNHELISQEEGSLLSDKGSLNVKSSMQLDHPDWNHVFAIGQSSCDERRQVLR